MDNIGKGILTGFAATIVLSAVMLMKSVMGAMPQLNAIQMQTQMLNQYIGTPMTPLIGWMMHFIIGTVLWGGLFGAFNHLVTGKTELAKGLWFSTAAWLLMMIVVMPMAGAGIFGLNIGVMAPVATLMLHLIFGAVLGYTYARLLRVPATDDVAAHVQRA
ncbi:MAG: DUF6789 family protein [Woeseiaceae bacterium]|nr:DUF6789 family protein [Woeseiaceae bacterium]